MLVNNSCFSQLPLGNLLKERKDGRFYLNIHQILCAFTVFTVFSRKGKYCISLNAFQNVESCLDNTGESKVNFNTLYFMYYL